MGLFGKHTKSGELGSMAQSLAKFAGGAVFAKDPQSSYGPSGGLVEGGEAQAASRLHAVALLLGGTSRGRPSRAGARPHGQGGVAGAGGVHRHRP